MWRCAPKEIDAINIYWSGLLAMRRAIDGLKLAPQHLLIDAKRLKEVTIPQQAIIKGDAKSASIAAASILAKVSRDALMRTLDECLPATVLPITRVILCVPTTSLCPGLAPAQPIEGRSDLCVRCWVCRRCRLGRRPRNESERTERARLDRANSRALRWLFRWRAR